jgi:A/G-specific adenine glycosylase
MRIRIRKMKTSAISIQARREDAQFVRRVISHYDKKGRHDLPWRKSVTPYRILVSEIMLQQTQVARVLPKFAVWMRQYPTLRSLGKAPFSEVLKLWQGLGYQRRAKALHEIGKAAKALPRPYDELLALPGIGPYTASAIQAFAYDTFPDYMIETNIRTALIEAFHQGEISVHDGRLYDDLARLSKMKSVQSLGARHFYYALMDYGAHLKAQKISHNEKSAHYARQSPFKGSARELRAKVLFAITHKKKLPEDERVQDALDALMKEGFIGKKRSAYVIL